MNIDTIIVQLVRQVADLAKSDNDFRKDLRVLGSVFREKPDIDQPEPTDTPKVVSVSEEVSSEEEKQDDVPDPQAEPTDQQRCEEAHDNQVHEPTSNIASSTVNRSTWTTPSDEELPKIELRCRLKAEGARWAADRKRKMADGAVFEFDIVPDDRSLIQRAKEADCYLWTNAPHAPRPTNLELLDQLGDCFESLADCLAFQQQAIEADGTSGDFFKSGISLLAEAQSALRSAVNAVSAPQRRVEEEQQRIFQWLLSQAEKLGIKIERHMRLDDPADPAESQDLRRRVAELRTCIVDVVKTRKTQRKLFDKLRYVAGQVHADSRQFEQQKDTLVRTLEDLVTVKVPPSNIEIRELVLPIVDKLEGIADLPKNVDLVIREVRRSQELAEPKVDEVAEQEPTAEVQKVKELLRGKSIVILGGTLTNESADALKSAFGLTEFHMPCSAKGTSYKESEKYIRRPEVTVVLITIARTGHEYHDAKKYCDRYDTPFVCLPAGQHPNQVAHQILNQAGDRLRKKYGNGGDSSQQR